MKISTGNGFKIDEDIEPESNVLAVYFKDQVSESGSGHDVHPVKLSEDSGLKKLEKWMTWKTSGGMETPAPTVTFWAVSKIYEEEKQVI